MERRNTGVKFIFLIFKNVPYKFWRSSVPMCRLPLVRPTRSPCFQSQHSWPCHSQVGDLVSRNYRVIFCSFLNCASHRLLCTLDQICSNTFCTWDSSAFCCFPRCQFWITITLNVHLSFSIWEETAQSPNPLSLFGFGAWTLDLDSGLSTIDCTSSQSFGCNFHVHQSQA